MGFWKYFRVALLETISLMSKFKQLIHKDDFAFGVLLALLLSIVVYLLFASASFFFPETFGSRYLRKQAIVLISVFINLLPFRAYLVSLKFEKTGRGILAAMFGLMILYFIFVHGNETV